VVVRHLVAVSYRVGSGLIVLGVLLQPELLARLLWGSRRLCYQMGDELVLVYLHYLVGC